LDARVVDAKMGEITKLKCGVMEGGRCEITLGAIATNNAGGWHTAGTWLVGAKIDEIAVTQQAAPTRSTFILSCAKFPDTSRLESIIWN
jgi:hypothetical protein